MSMQEKMGMTSFGSLPNSCTPKGSISFGRAPRAHYCLCMIPTRKILQEEFPLEEIPEGYLLSRARCITCAKLLCLRIVSSTCQHTFDCSCGQLVCFHCDQKK